MKTAMIATTFALLGSMAQADLLTRWENASEALSQRLFELYGKPSLFEPWTPELRSGKACILNEISQLRGAATVESFVAGTEAIAARRMSFAEPLELSVQWARISTENRIWTEDAARMVQTCGAGF